MSNAQHTPGPLEKLVARRVRNLEKGITPQAELDALRATHPHLATIAEAQNAAIRAAIAAARGQA